MKVPRHYECKYLLSHGREYCSVDCPICSRAKSLYKVKTTLSSESFSGSSPTVFVGRFGYPKVNMGIMAPPEVREDAWDLDAPRHWSAEGYEIPKLIDLRSSLINSKFEATVRGTNKFVELGQDIALAAKPADIEVDLQKRPAFRVEFTPDLAPSGPSAKLKKARITSNPKVPGRVEKAFSDTDLHAAPAIGDLYSHGFDENYLTRLLSAGTLGVKVQRKLVPTRWSITAVDDMVGKDIISELKERPFGEYWTWFGGYLGNYFLVLSFPDVWRYELFEMYIAPDERRRSSEVPFTTDFEDFGGRKQYANNTAGGYYASRLSVAEKLRDVKRQNSVLVLRFITDEYTAPLGVWVVREATRKAMASGPLEFASEELMLKYAESFAKKKFGYDINHILRTSKLYHEIKSQKKLSSFI